MHVVVSCKELNLEKLPAQSCRVLLRRILFGTTFVFPFMVSLMNCLSGIRMDEVTQAVENVKKEWDQAVTHLKENIAAIESCGKTGKGTEEANSLPRLNGSAQDALQLLKSLQFCLDL
jgi:hypothetical protein